MPLCKGPGPSSKSRCNQEPRRQARPMIEGTESAHLVHGPGSDAEALCLQISRGYLESDRVVAWIGDLAPALARPIIGSLGESSLENLRILDRDVKGIEGFLPGSDGLIVIIGWCPPIGRVRKSELTWLETILNASQCRVIATSLGNQDASGGGDRISEVQGQVGGDGALGWFLSKDQSSNQRTLEGPDSKFDAQRERVIMRTMLPKWFLGTLSPLSRKFKSP